MNLQEYLLITFIIAHSIAPMLALLRRPIITTSLLSSLGFSFSKKEKKGKKGEGAPRIAAKTQSDYMSGPEHLKKNILEVRKMQTTSQATLEEDSLREIITEQRRLLETSLREEAAPVQVVQQQSLRTKILNKYMTNEQLNKYYMRRPLKYLENIYFALFAVNAGALSWLEFTNAYSSIGWFFGYFTAPAATAAVAMLVGYNFAFWVVRQALHLHLPLDALPVSRISLTSATWSHAGELAVIGAQLAALAYSLCFGCPFAVYKLQILLVTANFGLLAANMRSILGQARVDFRAYLQDYLRVVSLTTLLVLIAALYHIQVTAGARPEDIFEDESYRARVVAVREGFDEYCNYFKQKNFVMQEDEKINPADAD